jgi:hypothetical protein
MGTKANDISNIMKKSVAEMVRRDIIPAEQYTRLLSVYPSFTNVKLFKVGDLVRYEGELFEVIQAHAKQAHWIPRSTPALFKKVEPVGVIPLWVQPLGGHDAYNIGDQVIFNGVVYKSTANANVWSPTVYGWVIV